MCVASWLPAPTRSSACLTLNVISKPTLASIKSPTFPSSGCQIVASLSMETLQPTRLFDVFRLPDCRLCFDSYLCFRFICLPPAIMCQVQPGLRVPALLSEKHFLESAWSVLQQTCCLCSACSPLPGIQLCTPANPIWTFYDKYLKTLPLGGSVCSVPKKSILKHKWIKERTW